MSEITAFERYIARVKIHVKEIALRTIYPKEEERLKNLKNIVPLVLDTQSKTCCKKEVEIEYVSQFFMLKDNFTFRPEKNPKYKQ